MYDFTFEDRFIIYHAPLRKQIAYIALDKNTGLSSEVCSWDTAVYNDANYKDLIPRILLAIRYVGDRRYANTMGFSPVDMIDSIFRVILPHYGYTVREEQIRLCKQMFKGFTQKQAAICEAEVGTGKSIAYLVAALCAKRFYTNSYQDSNPITVTTSSIELQKALADREIPQLSRALEEYHIIHKPLTAVLRKGKDHYFCRFRYRDYLRSIRSYPDKYGKQLEILDRDDFEDRTFDLDQLKIPGMLKGRICVQGGCGSRCPYAMQCRYKSFVTAAKSRGSGIDFQITNHNLYLLAARQIEVLQPSDFVIVDEAHKFKEAARDIFGERLEETTVPSYLNWIKTKCESGEDRSLFAVLLGRIAENNKKLFDLLRTLVSRDDLEDNRRSTITEPTGEMPASIFSVSQDLIKLDKMSVPNKGKTEISAEQISESLNTFLNFKQMIIWVDRDENGVLALCCSPKDVGEILARRIWRRDIRYVLTSGTMSDGQNFRYFKREIGLDRLSAKDISEDSTPSPFEYSRLARLYIPPGIPVPDSEGYAEAIAEHIVQIVDATNGHTAILFTSYKMLQRVHAMTAERLSRYDVICMTRSNKTAIADFKKSKNGVLFASGSMWEGVDCRGDRLSSVIIVRLPFPLRTAAMEVLARNCKNISEFVREYALPEMLIKLRQGVGRLVRSETDTGLIAILDSRAISNTYRDKVFRVLSAYPRVETLDEIRSFFRDVKSPEYFAE